MRRKKIRARVSAEGDRRLEFGIAAHGAEEALGAERVEAGARRDLDADRVGLKFLRARKAGQCNL